MLVKVMVKVSEEWTYVIAQVLWPTNEKKGLIRRDPDVGKKMKANGKGHGRGGYS